MKKVSLYIAVVLVIVISSIYLYAQSSAKDTTPKMFQQNGNSANGYYMIKINDNTFVTGKDLGDSQQIMVFKVSQQGQLVLTQKAKFMY